jgi:hypothetical protein
MAMDGHVTAKVTVTIMIGRNSRETEMKLLTVE